jgi:hypothetical protein
MTDEQKAHCNAIAKSFEFHMSNKYKKGVEEHGGNLWEMPEADLLDNAIDEAIDQVVYLLTLKHKPEYTK